MRWSLALALLPSLGLAETRVEICQIDMPATEGADVAIHSDGGRVLFVELGQYGHTLRQEIDLVPLSAGDAVLYLRVFRYDRPNFHDDAGPLQETLTESARALIRDGAICDARGCYWAQGAVTRAEVQDVYDLYVDRFPDRWDCRARPPR